MSNEKLNCKEILKNHMFFSAAEDETALKVLRVKWILHSTLVLPIFPEEAYSPSLE